ncbi:hypothetical protein BDB00DRAFT_785132 [Zychaea mexicana]|uniref:uncharacterized protein n=1 Tax=Zychaea mexicana TaxID=64656 RepID=UPI0022FEFF10|nr:uncharacterized protein BDB00DRAFT_785132 [Zychaea mexicana]KAI9497032.1 hypothetical protein BDB00DRAFT_785132 [Zychaea mexicana]
MTWCDLQYNVSFKQNSSTPAKLNIPIQLEPIINDLGGTCQLYRPKNYDDPETWPTMFEACKLSSTFTKQLFAAKDYWMYSLMLLWNHPDDDTLVTEKLQQTLHPSISPSVMNEYEQLLVNFLGELYDSCDTAGEVVREYSYSHKGIQTLVELLNDSDAKTYWIVLYMCKLLETEAPPNAYAEDHLTYTVGIIKAFNVCHNWTHPFQDQGSQLASLRRFRDAAFDDDIMHQNVAKSWDADGQETDELSNAKVIDVSYPFMDANSQSTQALSILTLCRLCNVFNQVKSDAIREIVRVPLLQVVEGLKGSEQRQKFQQLASSQVKSRLDSWRKGKKQKRRVILRPVIDPKHTDVVTYYTGLLEDPGLQSAISQTFKLVDGEQHQLPTIELL